jgi:hypothetical protein
MKKVILAGVTVILTVLACFSVFGVVSAARPGALYTIDNAAANSVLQFQTGPNGVVALTGTFSTHGNGTGARLASQGAVTLTQNGQWLLAVDAGSNQITSFQVNSGGSLKFVSVVSSEGLIPTSVTVHGSLVYVLDNGTATTPGNIAGFRLGSGGQLTYIPGSVQPLSGAANTSPEQIGFSNNGNVLIVTEKAAGMIDSYTVGTGGVASAPMVTSSNAAGPYGFSFTTQGYLVVTEAGSGTLSSYVVSDNGNLRTISGSIPDFGLAPCWVAVSPNGQVAYTSNAHGGTISGYSISGSGTLSLFSSVAAKASIPTLDVAFGGSNHNQFLYVLNGDSITGFQVYPDGGIAQVTTVSGLPASATGLAAT